MTSLDQRFPRSWMRPLSARAAVAIAGYASIAALLAWSRLSGLGQSFWHDEIITVTDYVRGGPKTIFVENYVPNNHQLFSLLGWITSELGAGDSEIALRLLAALPFIAGVVLVGAWLHVRVGATSAFLYGLLATCSPLLLDLSRQARGYGIAWLAASALVVAALELQRGGRRGVVVAFFLAGIVGSWTLPIFTVAFLAAALTLLFEHSLRKPVAIGLALSGLAIALWYAPHVDDLVASSKQEFGEPIMWHELFLAPIDRLITPGLLGGGEGSVWILTVLVLIVLVASPLARGPMLFVLAGGIVTTLVVMWIGDLFYVPRFGSYLLVPAFLLLATGLASILERPTTIRSAGRKTVAALLVMTALLGGASRREIVQLPREAHRNAAETVRRLLPSGTVVAHLRYPGDLSFYLDDRPLETLAPGPHAEEQLCTHGKWVAFVTHGLVDPVVPPCAVQRVRLPQHSRGGYIDVWLLRERR